LAQLAKLHWDGSKVAVGNIANALQYNGDARSLIENAVGGSGDDTIVGNQTANALKGNTGNDALTGGAGNDLLDGGAGSDTAVFSGTRSNYSVMTLADGSLQVIDLRASGPDGKDTVWGVEWFQFTDKVYAASGLGPDTMTMTDPVILTPTVPEDLTLTGTSGSNRLYGGAGDDKLYGKAGSDLLNGGAGSDKFVGGTGKDVLYGGSGADVFDFNSLKESRGSDVDTIKDFRRGSDHIDLRSIDANSKVSGNQAFSFIGKSDFTGKAGQLKFSGGVLLGDVNGDGAADFKIKVSDLSTLSKGDFYL
jgi:serralysin